MTNGGANKSRDVESRPRTPHGKWTKGKDSIARDARALELRGAGRTLQEISDELGYGSPANAHRAIEKATDRIQAPAVDSMRKTMDAQLEHLYRKGMEVLEATHLRVNNGVVVYYTEQDANGNPIGTPRPLTDDSPILRAMDSLLRVQERRAKLFGLDAPVKVNAEVQSVHIQIDGEGAEGV